MDWALEHGSAVPLKILSVTFFWIIFKTPQKADKGDFGVASIYSPGGPGKARGILADIFMTIKNSSQCL